MKPIYVIVKSKRTEKVRIFVVVVFVSYSVVRHFLHIGTIFACVGGQDKIVWGLGTWGQSVGSNQATKLVQVAN